ncbi:FHA domain-containing protein [Microbacterium sp. cx-59]|uniref:FHA domain-containing protein n=1 Tax=Microbacterium sp. cx-59 TaxID=2891207 RepID=UPI001E502EED|nr:FHA domain-containing protein [Microbacterium sp. cx-59]MCC4906726.1 hypothetical protein [Microbacterium sp. cx-59]
MTERTWFDGDLPAVATDRLAVLVGGADGVPAARRVLAITGASPDPTEVLDALVAEGIAAVPAFAIVALDEGHLTAFLRGPFALRFEDGGRRVWRVDGVGAHTWREVAAEGVTRAWAGAPGAEPRLLDLGTTPERPVRSGPTTATGVVLRTDPAVRRSDPVAVPPAPAKAPVRIPLPPGVSAPPPLPHGIAAPPPVPTPRAPRIPRAILLPDGERVPIEGTLLVGRGPRTERVDGEHLPTLVPIPQAPRDVSRSHVRIWSDGTRVQIEDLATSGGTALVDAGGVAVRLIADRPAEVQPGSVAELPGGARIRFVEDE